jgi:hypothetical protein
MSDLTDTLPPELLAADRKRAVLEYLHELSLPARFKRKLLQDWGAAVGVDLAGTDYEAVTAPK